MHIFSPLLTNVSAMCATHLFAPPDLSCWPSHVCVYVCTCVQCISLPLNLTCRAGYAHCEPAHAA